MKKRILAILACVLMMINVFAFSACDNIESWGDVDAVGWYKQVKVTVDIPEKVVLGEYFKIKVTTKNISKSNV